jgi:hypothetical protein
MLNALPAGAPSAARLPIISEMGPCQKCSVGSKFEFQKSRLPKCTIESQNLDFAPCGRLSDLQGLLDARRVCSTLEGFARLEGFERGSRVERGSIKGLLDAVEGLRSMLEAHEEPPGGPDRHWQAGIVTRVSKLHISCLKRIFYAAIAF